LIAHDQVTADIQERAALFALGLLPAEEAAAFEEHSGACSVCAEEIRHFRETAAHMGFAADPVQPHPRVRERLLAAVRQSRVDLPSGVSVIRAAEGKWRRTPWAGVTYKNLYSDPATNYFTSLLRIEAGAQYPPHRHTGVEQCLVLEGSVRLGGAVLYPGDFELADAQSVHGVIETDTGCLLLIIASQSDEILHDHV
jgi:quercetin dioxygenase-like cupin family protein